MCVLSKLIGKIKHYLFTDNRGVVSVDFIVLTAGTAMLSASVLTSIAHGLQKKADGISDNISLTGTQISNSAGAGSSSGKVKTGGNTAKAKAAAAKAAELAIAQLVQAMVQEQFPSISPDQMKYLQTSQLAAVDSAWWFGQIPSASRDMLTAAQIKSISPSVLGPNAGKLTAKQIGWMTADQIKAVKGGGPIVNMVKTLPTILSKVTPDQIATVKDPWWFGQLITASGGALSKKQINAAAPWAISTTAGKLTAQQIGWMTSDQLKAVTGGDAIVNMVKTRPAVLSDITTGQIASIDKPWWFGQLINASGGKLSKKQIQAAPPSAISTTAGKLTSKQIGWLTSDQFKAVKGGDAIVNMVKTRPTVLSDITPDQIASIDNTWWFGQLINASDGKLSKKQIKAATPSALSKTAGKLTAKQTGWLSSAQIKGVKGGGPIVNMIKTQPAFLSEITPSQIATIKDPWWFGQMPSPLLQAMSQVQVKAIPANIYPNLKGRLTADQQAWRP